MKFKKIIAASLAVIAAAALFACKNKNEEDADASTDPVKVEMSVKDYGTIKLELYPDIAPETVKNFVCLVNEGFYDGLTFHRIVDGFMIQGGDPEGTGMGGSDKTIKGEFAANGVQNTLSHTEGVISMARKGGDMDSATSQFFICLSDKYTSSLDGQYAAFGKVTDGMDVVSAIGKAEVTTGLSGEKSSPVTPVVIEYIKVVD